MTETQCNECCNPLEPKAEECQECGTMTHHGRVERIEEIIMPYTDTFQEPQTAAVDLLADLRHWIEEKGLDLDSVNATAQNHFEEET